MSTEDLHALVRLLQEKTPLHQLSNMEARTTLSGCCSKGFKITAPTT